MKTIKAILVALLIAAPAQAQFRSVSTNGTASYILPGAYLLYNQGDTNVQMVVSGFFDLLNAQSGLLDDNNISSTIARDSEVTAAVAALSTVYQPLDSDLTAIAALTTTSFGRGLLDDADGAAVRTTIGAGTSSFDGAFSSLTGKPTTLGGYGITDGLTAIQTTNVANAAALTVSVDLVLAALSTNTLSVSNLFIVQAVTFPTNAIPLGSLTATNIAIVNWKGFVRYVATNRANAFGFMEQTNGAWWPFTP